MLYNPLDGRVVDRARAEIAAYSEEEIARLVAALERGEPGPGQWQIRAILGIASSGRRITSILSLTPADHDFEAGTVVWRAEFAKGTAYGRGDVVMPMTPLHRAAVLWALEHHPNPNGPEAPLIYRTRNPAEPMRQSAADRQLKRLEERAGVQRAPGRAFHGFCRAAITLVSDLFGDEVASEFTGRKPETIRRYSYKKIVPKTMQKVAAGMERWGKEQEGGE